MSDADDSAAPRRAGAGWRTCGTVATTPWARWAGAGEPRGHYLPGAQQLELLRRLNAAGRGLRRPRRPGARRECARSRSRRPAAGRRHDAAAVRSGPGRPRRPARRRAGPGGLQRDRGRRRRRGAAGAGPTDRCRRLWRRRYRARGRPACSPSRASADLLARGRREPGTELAGAGAGHRPRPDAGRHLDRPQPRRGRGALGRVDRPRRPRRQPAAAGRPGAYGGPLARAGRPPPGARRPRPGRGARTGRGAPSPGPGPRALRRRGRPGPPGRTGGGRPRRTARSSGPAARAPAAPAGRRSRGAAGAARPARPTSAGDGATGCATACSRVATLSSVVRTALLPVERPGVTEPSAAGVLSLALHLLLENK